MISRSLKESIKFVEWIIDQRCNVHHNTEHVNCGWYENAVDMRCTPGWTVLKENVILFLGNVCTAGRLLHIQLNGPKNVQ
jgi:hypothetical protein